ncbi:MAG: ATPase [Proteobacteria bacterium]|nr:ATPase [Pseudomonadota bacterium]
MRRISLRDSSLLIALTATWAFFALFEPSFVDSRNISNLFIELSTTSVAALGMFLVILIGHIDLAVGSIIGLTGGIASVLITQQGWPAAPAMAMGLLAGVAGYTVMGLLVARERIPAFIITLGGLLVFRGLFWKIIESETIPVKQGDVDNLLSLQTTYYLPAWLGYALAAAIVAAMIYAALRRRTQRRRYGFELEEPELLFGRLFVIGQVFLLSVIVLNQFRGVPLSLVILGFVSFAIHVLVQHTRFGRYLYACGGNVEAARLSGVPVKLITIGAFAIAGITASITGFMQTAYGGASTSSTGELMELDAIAACVIGGTALSGGRGTVMGVLIGAFLIASLLNGMTLMAVSPEAKYIARGLVLALAVWVDVKLSRR